MNVRRFPLLLLFFLGACGNQAPSTGGVAVSEQPRAIPGDLARGTWQVRMSDAAVRAPYEAQAGWAALVMDRDFQAALQSFSSTEDSDGGLSRVHVDMSAAYRQAALLAARATVQIYGEMPRPEDPPQLLCLLGVAQAMLGRDDPAEKHLADCDPSGDQQLAGLRTRWLGALQSGSRWPPPPSVLEFRERLPASSTVASPDAGGLPHFLFHDNVEQRQVPATDPSSLLELALSHQELAVDANPVAAAIIEQLLRPWRLPSEPLTTSTGPTDPALWDPYLFGSTLMVPRDAAFLAALSSLEPSPGSGAGPQPAGGAPRARAGPGTSGSAAGAEPTPASVAALGELMAEYVGSSAVAAALEPCLDNQGPQLDAQCVLDRAALVYDQLMGAMQITSGEKLGFHQPFALLARVGVLRAAAELATVLADSRTQGLIRINILDLAAGPAGDPVLLLSVAAWDAGNRNAGRAQELLHAQVGYLPGIEVARYPLDALQVRLSRESAPGLPMH